MTITITTSTTVTVKTITMTITTTKITRSEILKRTIITLIKRQFTTKSWKHNCRKFERKNINSSLNLKTYEEQAAQIDLSQRNKSNECINSAQINSKVTNVKWPK